MDWKAISNVLWEHLEDESAITITVGEDVIDSETDGEGDFLASFEERSGPHLWGPTSAKDIRTYLWHRRHDPALKDRRAAVFAAVVDNEKCVGYGVL